MKFISLIILISVNINLLRVYCASTSHYHETLEYLREFGYLTNDESSQLSKNDGVTHKKLTDALRELQVSVNFNFLMKSQNYSFKQLPNYTSLIRKKSFFINQQSNKLYLQQFFFCVIANWQYRDNRQN